MDIQLWLTHETERITIYKAVLDKANLETVSIPYTIKYPIKWCMKSQSLKLVDSTPPGQLEYSFSHLGMPLTENYNLFMAVTKHNNINQSNDDIFEHC